MLTFEREAPAAHGLLMAGAVGELHAASNAAATIITSAFIITSLC